MDEILDNLEKISNSIRDLAGLLKSERHYSEKYKDSLKETDTRFDEDDFTNIHNGYQYVLDDLKSAYRSLSSASMQCQFIVEDEKALRRKYD